MNKPLAVAAAAEAATGLPLLLFPEMVIRLFLGVEIAGVGIAVSRVAGISLIALGLACWPGRNAGSPAALLGMLTYSVLAMINLGYLAIAGEWVGPLLWPAVANHAVLSTLLTWEWIRKQERATLHRCECKPCMRDSGT